MSQKKPTPARPAAPQAPKDSSVEANNDSKAVDSKTVTLAHNVRTKNELFRAGQTYPVGTKEGEINPAWLESDPRLDATHRDNAAARSKREALQQKIRARNFEDQKSRRQILANVGHGPTRRRVGLV